MANGESLGLGRAGKIQTIIAVGSEEEASSSNLWFPMRWFRSDQDGPNSPDGRPGTLLWTGYRVSRSQYRLASSRYARTNPWGHAQTYAMATLYGYRPFFSAPIFRTSCSLRDIQSEYRLEQSAILPPISHPSVAISTLIARHVSDPAHCEMDLIGCRSVSSMVVMRVCCLASPACLYRP